MSALPLPPDINTVATPTGVPETNPPLIDWMTQVQTQAPVTMYPPPGLDWQAWLQRNRTVVIAVAGGLFLLALLKKR